MKRSDFRKYNKNTCETKAFFELKKKTGKRKQRQEPSVRRQAPKVFLPPNDPLSVFLLGSLHLSLITLYNEKLKWNTNSTAYNTFKANKILNI